MRLQKYLAECSIASRRGSEKLIQDGRVTVDGEPAQVGQTVNPEVDTILFDGTPVLRDTKVYVLLNKPQGVITTAKDTHGRKTVIDLITGVTSRIFPVGRLDMDVTGTLLLTNDGELTNRLAHPRYQVDKVYHAWVKGIVHQETLHKLKKGIMLEDGITAPAKAKILKTQHQTTLIRLTIHEGRKRLVKRMCASVGHPINNLRRISVASINADGLQPGE
ncbi:MAG: pseudouridine synthase [Candidatus Hydrogenedentota bacterium]